MSRDRLLRDLLRQRFVVTLKTGETFDGLLDRCDESTIELVDAYAVAPAERAQVDGRLYLPRPQVAYMQVPEVRG